MDLKGVFDFKVCSTSYKLLGGRGNFYMPDQTLEIALVKSEVFVLYTSARNPSDNWKMVLIIHKNLKAKDIV